MLFSGPFDNPAEFFTANDQLEFNACLSLLTQIGEQSNKLSPMLIAKYKEVDWVKIRGLRNRIVHDYTGVDLYIIFDTIKKQVPELKPAIENIIRTELQEGNFDKDEFTIAQTSPYLRHVDFSMLN